MARHLLMTPFGPVDRTFSWMGVAPESRGPRRERGRHAAPDARTLTSPGVIAAGHPAGAVGGRDLTATALPPMAVRPRRPLGPLRLRTPPADRPDNDILRRVLTALYAL